MSYIALQKPPRDVDVTAARWHRTGRTLGQGGQAQVLVVTDRSGQLEGNHALKFLLDVRRSPRLDLEINTMKSLFRSGGPVLEVVDDYLESEPDAEHPWFVTPVADGGDLARRLSDGGPYAGSLAQALSAFRELCGCVRFLHDSGIAHRDLKPSNILIHEERFVLADLGLCLPLSQELDDQRLTQTLERIGSINYMPPEAFGRQEVSRDQYAFDAYALGKILYEFVAGQTLPGFESPVSPDYSLVKADPRPVVAATSAVIRQLLDERPDRRLQILEKLDATLSELEQWANEEPAVAKPELRDRLVFASEALAQKLAVPPASAVREASSPASELADALHEALQSSAALTELRDRLIHQYPDDVELTVSRSTGLRDFVSGAYVRTHRGLEPLEDQGYPKWPSTQEGCLASFGPKGSALQEALPKLALGALASATGEDLIVAICIARRAPGDRASSDIVRETVRLAKGPASDPSVMRRSLDALAAAAEQFVEMVIDAVAK